jgi:hypothetical protein
MIEDIDLVKLEKTFAAAVDKADPNLVSEEGDHDHTAGHDHDHGVIIIVPTG